MLKRYGFFGCIKLIRSVIFTRIFFRSARLIRLPFDIRNKRLILLGKGFTTGFGCRLEAHPFKNTTPYCITIGKNVQINDYVHIAAGQSVTIGDNVLIASKVFITDLNHGSYNNENSDDPLIPPNNREINCNPVSIEENVWLGENVCVMPGVKIGKGTIIGASAVVTKNIPAYVIAVGNPAKIIKSYNFETKIWETAKLKNDED